MRTKARVYNDHGQQNMATLRQISHNLLKRGTSLKVGIQGKRLQAGWREDYLVKVLLIQDAIALEPPLNIKYLRSELVAPIGIPVELPGI